MVKSSAKSTKAPWRKSNPRKRAGQSSRKLSLSQKTTAKRRARKAGRPYPNLVDNMNVAAKARRKRAKKRK
jgi:hypothetical protein